MVEEILSEKLHNKLIEYANKIRRNIILKNPQDEFKHEQDLKLLSQSFGRIFVQLYEQSTNEKYYWQYSQFEVYKIHLEDLVKKFLKVNYSDATKEDFYLEELEKIKDYYEEDSFVYEFPLLESIRITNETIKIALNILDKKTIKNIKYSQNKKIEFLKSKISKQTLNPHRKIFVDHESFELFKYLLSLIGKNHSDITYIYRIMFLDDFIHQDSESIFRNWLKYDSGYNISIDSKLQQLEHSETKSRRSLYEMALNKFNLISTHYSKTVSK